jgi:hypothetical protein
LVILLILSVSRRDAVGRAGHQNLLKGSGDLPYGLYRIDTRLIQQTAITSEHSAEETSHECGEPSTTFERFESVKIVRTDNPGGESFQQGIIKNGEG